MVSGETLSLITLPVLVVFALAISGRTRGIDELKIRQARLERKINLILEHLGIEDGISPDGVEELILRGQKIQAIKLYREHHQVGLKEAKDIVEEMAVGLRARKAS